MKTTDSKNTTRPDYVTDAHLEYLDDLRESGVTNMFGAAPYLDAAFPGLARCSRKSYGSSQKAQDILGYWMNTFGEPNR